MSAQNWTEVGGAHDVVGVGDSFHHEIAVFVKIFVAAKVDISEAQNMAELVRQDTRRNVVGTENDRAPSDVSRDRARGERRAILWKQKGMPAQIDLRAFLRRRAFPVELGG